MKTIKHYLPFIVGLMALSTLYLVMLSHYSNRQEIEQQNRNMAKVFDSACTKIQGVTVTGLNGWECVKPMFEVDHE